MSSVAPPNWWVSSGLQDCHNLIKPASCMPKCNDAGIQAASKAASIPGAETTFLSQYVNNSELKAADVAVRMVSVCAAMRASLSAAPGACSNSLGILNGMANQAAAIQKNWERYLQ